MNYLQDDRTWSFLEWLGFSNPRRPPKLVWWRPRWREVLRRTPWAWAMLAPILVGVALVAGGAVAGPGHGAVFWVGMKILLLALVIPAVTWDHLRHNVIRARLDPFCIHCGWTLTGLPQEGRCPECGRAYRMKVVEMFRRDPQWVMAYWRLSGKPPSAEVFEKHHPARASHRAPRERNGLQNPE